MSATHNDLVSNDTKLDTPLIQRAGFSTPLIVGPCGMSDRVRTYSTPKGAKADLDAGDLTQDLYDHIAAALAQNNAPTQVRVGRIEADQAQVITVTVGGADDGDYIIALTTKNGTTTYTHTASGSSTGAIATALAALVDANADAGAGATGDDIAITATVAGDPISVTVTAPGDNLTQATTTANRSIATELDLVLAASPTGWWGFGTTLHTDADLLRASAWAEANKRYFAGQTSSAAAKTSATTDVLSVHAALNYTYSRLVWRASDASMCAWVWLCDRLSFDPDQRSAPWNITPLVGEVADTLTDTEKATLLGKRALLYLPFFGVPVLRWDSSAGGIDPKRLLTKAWTDARLNEALADLLVRRNKAGLGIEYSQDGQALPRAEVGRVLAQGERVGHYLPGTSRVVFTRFGQIGDDDRAAKRFPYTYGAQLADSAESFSGTGYAYTDPNFATFFDELEAA